MRWGRAHWWIAGSAIAVYFCLVMKFAVNVPADDDYDNIFKFYFQLDHMRAPIDIAQVFFSQHNENRLLFNRTVFVLERLLTGGTDLRRLIVAGNLGVLALFGLLAGAHRGRPIFPFAVVTSALLLFQPSAYEAMFWAMDGLLRNYVLVFALLSFLALEKGWLCAAACLACLSLYTQANGLLAVLVNAAWLLCQAMYTKAPHAKRRLALWALLCVGPVGMYFAHFVPPPQEPSIAESLAHPFRLTAYFLAYVGSGVGYLGIGAAIAAGTGLTCLAAYLTYRGYFSRQPALYAFMIFLFGSAALSALGRSGFGVEQALSSRYSIISSCLFACVAVGVASVVAVRNPWQVVAQMGMIVIALAYACAAYAVCVPVIKERRDTLIAGAALFAHCGRTTGLQYAGNRLTVGKLMRYMEERQYWSFPPEVSGRQPNEPCPTRDGVAIVPMMFSAHAYRGEKLIGRTDGSVAIQVRDQELHVEVWADIPAEDPEAVVYLGAPVLPSGFSTTDLRRDAAQPSHPTVGLDITAVGFPADTDMQAVADDACVAYESTSLPLTLFAGNLPICAERLLAVDP